MFPILQAAQMRCDHGTDWTGIGRAIRVPPNVAENRANVEAGAAADAMKRVALLGVGEQLGPMIIQQDDMILFWSVGLTRLTRAAIERVVTGERLAGAGGGQHRE